MRLDVQKASLMSGLPLKQKYSALIILIMYRSDRVLLDRSTLLHIPKYTGIQMFAFVVQKNALHPIYFQNACH